MKAQERLFLTADKDAVVGEGDRRAAFLYAAPGDEIPQSAAERFGIVDGRAPRRKAGASVPPAGGGKSGEQGEDKRRSGGEDKDTRESEKGGGAGAEGAGPTVPPDDLTKVKGIGKATAEALVAAGINTFAQLAGVDPANPPTIAGLAGRVAWDAWVKEAHLHALAGAE